MQWGRNILILLVSWRKDLTGGVESSCCRIRPFKQVLGRKAVREHIEKDSSTALKCVDICNDLKIALIHVKG